VLYRSGLPQNGADGVETECANRPDYNGLAGVDNLPLGRFLCGVFIDETVPSDPSPDGLDHNSTSSFVELTPTLNQIFYVGDGLTGTDEGDTQTFIIPEGATRLFFGFIDGFGCADPPGWYGDNTGTISITVHFQIDCLADTNGDGSVSPADFSAWVAAFNAMAPECDQNDDGSCTPADFSAWVANYNAGC